MPEQGDRLTQTSISTKSGLHYQIIDFCRHIAGSAQVTAVSLFENYQSGLSNIKPTMEIMLVIRDFQPRLLSYVKIIGGRNIIVLAVDQWIFERDVERGFLGEALAGTLIIPYKPLFGGDYLHVQEVMLKKRLILELLENLVLSFPELSSRLHIKPQYFMYEVLLNRVRVFPPLAYGLSNFLNGSAPKKEAESVLRGFTEALNQLEKEKKIHLSEGYVTLARKFVAESQNPKLRFTNISKNAPRTLFSSLVGVFPQLINFFSQSTEALLKMQKIIMKKEKNKARHFVDPQKYVLVPTAKGLVPLAGGLDIEAFARKMLLNGENAEVKFEQVGGVLNDVYLIKARSNGLEEKVLVKRFKDWSGFKWFPLAMWSFGTRTFAVSGRARLAKECAISEFLQCEGFKVPKILHVNHSGRLIFMEYIEGENLSRAIKRIAIAQSREKVEKELTKIMRVGEILAKVHSLNVSLGDTKPENMIVTPHDEIYLLDFEQASRGGDKAWDVAVFLYYSGHYLQPLYSNTKAESIARAFISGYLKGGGDVDTIKKAGASKYTRIFSVFTMPSTISAISNVCKKIEA